MPRPLAKGGVASMAEDITALHNVIVGKRKGDAHENHLPFNFLTAADATGCLHHNAASEESAMGEENSQETQRGAGDLSYHV